MTIQKIEEQSYKAEQKIGNGILAFVVKAYGTTALEALKNLLNREYKTN